MSRRLESVEAPSSTAPPGMDQKTATVIGSGMLARAFSGQRAGWLADVTVYAAGVSNSGCSDPREFEREEARLQGALASAPAVSRFIYLSTCGVYEDESRHGPYVRHKLAMENLVRARGRHVIFRFPQLVGLAPNPHTLINYLFFRMIRSERFQLWAKATRNILDVEDAVALAVQLLCGGAVDETINIANPRSIAMVELVQTMERVLAVRGICDVLDQGAAYAIDTTRIHPVIDRLGLRFGSGYVSDVITKYYGGRRAY